MIIEKKYLSKLPDKPEVTESDAQAILKLRIEELEQRLEKAEATIEFLAQFESTLQKAVKGEIELLQEAASLTKGEYLKTVFVNIASALRRIEDRWADGVSYKIDASRMKIIKVEKE